MATPSKEDVGNIPNRDRNVNKEVKGYDEKNPNKNDIHSDDPLVAGLANGQRQSEGSDEGRPVDSPGK